MKTQTNSINRLTALSVGLFILLFTAYCGSGKSQNSNFDVAANENPRSTSCFKKYVGNLDQMLTKADILKHYKLDFEKVETEYDTKYVPVNYQQSIYFWKSNNRTMEISGMELPVNNRIGVGYLNFYSEDVQNPRRKFVNTYTLTEAEKAKAKKALSKSLGAKEGPVKKMGELMSRNLIDKQKYTLVEGIGNAAYWDHLESSLKVLKGRARFDVFVNISDEVKTNKALAKKLAASILKKCQ